jgi:hypothetical protein
VTAELFALAAIVVLPAGLILAWLALMGALVAALAVPTESEAA